MFIPSNGVGTVRETEGSTLCGDTVCHLCVHSVGVIASPLCGIQAHEDSFEVILFGTCTDIQLEYKSELFNLIWIPAALTCRSTNYPQASHLWRSIKVKGYGTHSIIRMGPQVTLGTVQRLRTNSILTHPLITNYSIVLDVRCLLNT